MAWHQDTKNWGKLWTTLRGRVGKYTSGTKVTAVNERDDGTFELMTEESTEVFDAVLGCDGFKSIVRSTLFPGSFEPRYAGYVLFRGTIAETQRRRGGRGGVAPLVAPCPSRRANPPNRRASTRYLERDRRVRWDVAWGSARAGANLRDAALVCRVWNSV